MSVIEFMRREGVKPDFFPHVKSILHYCHGDRQQMQDAIDQLRRNQPRWFY